MTSNAFTQAAGIEVPIICGPMYPCSNPELVAAVSEAGGLGIVQPISLTYVYGYDFVEGLRFIRSLTNRPIGMNVLIEKTSKRHHEQMVQWVDLALQEGVRFFITSLGKPDWVVQRVHAAGGIVYHDVTERKWAVKGIDCGVDGLIAVNKKAGGHLGALSAQVLYADLSDFNKPIICAGGIGSSAAYRYMLDIGYSGVQMGTRFIATQECDVPEAYKEAVVSATEQDIVTTERVSGVPVSVIRTPYVERLGLKSGRFERWMLTWTLTKYIMRSVLLVKSLKRLKHAVKNPSGKDAFWQAGKSVTGIKSIEPVKDIIESFKQAAN